MKLTSLPPDEAIGHILAHNLPDARGGKALPKGHRLTAADLPLLRALDLPTLPVAVLEPGDVHEDEAARRLSQAVSGQGVKPNRSAAGRVNLLSEAAGVVKIDIETLVRINELDGLTVATLPHNAYVDARKRIATVKIIPFAVREEALAEAETIARTNSGVVGLRALQALQIGVVLVGSAAAQARIERGVYPAIVGRIEAAGASIIETRYVMPEEQAVAAAIQAQITLGARLLIVAGETSVMDIDDVTPQGIRQAGGRIEHYGAPVEPGNLLLLAYLEIAGVSVPIIGAPGCIRSRDINIVDLLLPRLLAGEQITRRDIITLGHGGLLA